MPLMNCPDRNELFAYATGKVDVATDEGIAGHLEACARCQAALVTIDDVGDTLIARLRRHGSPDPYSQEPQCAAAVERAEAILENARLSQGAPAEVATTASVMPAKLGEYELIEKLGEGGMGAVYKARHTRLDRIVALKVLSHSRTADPKAAARFEREMKAVGRLSHPHVVQAHDARDIDGTAVLVMEYVEGLDLAQVVQRLGPLPIAAACELVRQAALGLQYAHENGLVHRDIKPSNLMLTNQGQVKILDLGLALLGAEQADEALTNTGVPMGTADFMAPEQAFDSHHVDIRADIYSLGCTLYKLLTGHPPFSGPEYQTTIQKMLAHAETPPPPLGESRADVPPELAALLERMLAKDSADRYATPDEVAAAIGPLAAGADLGNLYADAQGAGILDSPQAGAVPGPATQGGARSQRPTTGRRPYASTLAVGPPRPVRRLLRAALAGAVLGAGLLAVAGLLAPKFFRPGEPEKATTTGAPLAGTVDVLVWSPGDRVRQGMSLRDPGTLPLRSGDQVRVKAEVNRPAFVYLLWIDTQGRVSPVYPWTPGRWAERPEDEAATDRLGLPKELDRGWPMEGGPGMETVVLLARDTPLPGDFDLAQQLSDLGPQIMQGARAIADFENGQLVPEAKPRDRAPNFDDSRQIDDVVLKTQQRIAERLGPHFPLIRAVSFANAGKGP